MGDLFPNGWHPVQGNYSRDGLHKLSLLAHISHPVRYYLIDFGLSPRFLSGQTRLVVGLKGCSHDVPELSDIDSYNPFKVDIFMISNFLSKEFQQKFLGLGSLNPLLCGMIANDPDQHPTVDIALERWQSTRETLGPSTTRWRLCRSNETTPGRVIRDAVARDGFQVIKRWSVHDVGPKYLVKTTD